MIQRDKGIKRGMRQDLNKQIKRKGDRERERYREKEIIDSLTPRYDKKGKVSLKTKREMKSERDKEKYSHPQHRPPLSLYSKIMKITTKRGKIITYGAKLACLLNPQSLP